MIKSISAALVAAALCGTTFATEKPVEDVEQRIAPPDLRPLSGTWCYDGPPLGIPGGDAGAASAELVITDSETIEHLTVDIQIVHTWIGDLRAHLTNGTCEIQLFHRIGLDGDTCCGCHGDDIDITLDDDAPGSVEDSCGTGPSGGAAGSFTPGDPQGNGGIWPTAMACCSGQDVQGTWTLTVTDGAGLDTGALMGWCMTNTSGGGDGGDGCDGGDVPASDGLGAVLAVLAILGAGAYFLRR